MDPFSEYIPPDRMEAFTAFQAAKRKDFPELGLVGETLRLPGHRRAHRRQPGRGGGPEERRPDREDRRPARARPRPVGSGGEAGGEARPARLAPRRPRREAPAQDARDRGRIVDAEALVCRQGPGRDRRHDSVVRPRDGEGGRGTPRPVRPDEAARPGSPGERLGLLRRGGAHGGALRPRRPARRALRPEDRDELFRSEAGERVHDSRLVLLVDSGTAGPAEFFAAAVREALDKTPPKAAEKRAKFERDVDGTIERLDEEAEAPGERETPLSWNGKLVRLVGEPSMGMAFTQQVVRMQSGGALQVSVGKIRTLSGRAPRRRGSRPTTASTTSRRTKRSTSPRRSLPRARREGPRRGAAESGGVTRRPAKGNAGSGRGCSSSSSRSSPASPATGSAPGRRRGRRSRLPLRRAPRRARRRRRPPGLPGRAASPSTSRRLRAPSGASSRS